jgi:CubicO group peptidase (beta-lactamase class C family)
MPLDFQPGEDWGYRNTDYVLLGILIRKITGEFYADFFARADIWATRDGPYTDYQ